MPSPSHTFGAGPSLSRNMLRERAGMVSVAISQAMYDLPPPRAEEGRGEGAYAAFGALAGFRLPLTLDLTEATEEDCLYSGFFSIYPSPKQSV